MSYPELYPAVLVGHVTHLDDLGPIVLVHLDCAPGVPGVVILDYPQGAATARRWPTGARITAWGWTNPAHFLARTPLVIRAHTVQRWTATKIPNPNDPIRRIPPRQRPLPARYQQPHE